MLSILWAIIKILLYGYGGWCIGRHSSQLISRLIKKNRISNAAKRELKAEYFEKCGEIIKLIGTEEWDEGKDAFFKDIQKITNKMCDAGMGAIAKQEFDNIKDLCIDLGYYAESEKDE
jgi:hypothetical protein